MKKHLTKALALLLAVVMTLTLLPAAVFATEEGETATLVTGLPEDGSYGVIYSCGEGFDCVMGYDISEGNAAVKATKLEGSTIKLPEGTGVFKFVKNTDGSYYLMLGSKYLISVGEVMSLSDTLVTGAKWVFETDAGGMEGAYNIKNATDKYSGKAVYLEQYNSTKFCTYTYNGANPKYYQFKVFSCSEDTDGRIGAVTESGALPTDGSKIVIYNAYSSACFGQEQGGDAPSLAPAFSKMENGALAYDNIGNGALIFTVHYAGGYYTFENNGKYLANPENYTSTEGKTMNDETLKLQDTETEYTKWELSAVNGGYVMYNKTAKYYSSKVCIEFFNEVFSGWSYSASNNEYFAMQFYPVEDKHSCGYVVNPDIVFSEDLYANKGVNCDVSFIVDDIPGIDTLTASYWCDSNDAKAKTATLTPDETVKMKYHLTVPAAELTNRKKLHVKVDMTDKLGISISKTLSLTIDDKIVITEVYPAPNAATGSVTRPEITITFVNAGTPIIELLIDDVEVKPTVKSNEITYKPDKAMAKGKHTIEITIERSDGEYVERTWSFFIGDAGVSTYFGQIHSHTAEYSDGAGQLEDAYEHAYAAKDVDYLIVTDHSNYFDTTATAVTKSYYDLSTLSKSADGTLSKWEEARATAATYNERYGSEFVCAYGYEMTWSGGPGHTNTFNTYGTVSRNNGDLNSKKEYAGMYLYNDLMVNANKGLDVNGEPVAEGVKTKYIDDAPVVSQFNHPGSTFGTFGDFIGCTSTRDTVLNLVEVGNGEGAVGGSSYWPSYEQYDNCLAMGWHVAPTNNQDNHKGKWGNSNTCRDVVLTDDFTEEGIYKALSARHVYATEDQNLEMIYYLNVSGEDYLQGDIANTDGAIPETVTVKCSLYDEDGEGLGKIQIIGENGKVVYSQGISGSSYEFSHTIDNEDAYYYVKVIQADGDIAVSAPVWTSTAVPVNVSVKTDCAVAIEDTEEEIQASILNGDENETIEITNYTIVVGDKTLVSSNVSAVVKPGENYGVSAPYTPAKPDTYKITVYFQFEYKDKEYTYEAHMNETALDKDDVVYVGIDNAHDNYYVSGDYADTTSNMIDFCADSQVVCDFIEEGEMFYNNLRKYEVIFLTVNYKRNVEKAKDYTADELWALSKYVEEGGKVIICSKSDRDNTFDNCAENTNKLLEAIGAHTRIVNGIIVDSDLKANEAYRIYFSSIDCFNTEHRFTAGTYSASNAFGTTPSGANQSGFQLYNGGPVEIMKGYENQVDVLVKGYDTTWASHYDGYFTSGSFVPEYDGTPEHVTVDKGDVNIMTYEETDEGGWIITSGVTFFSDYDIKDDVAYANKYILRNILDDLTGKANKYPISEISTVKKKTAGEYSIEGYVTSNASAYDQDTAFFDCIYMQDKHDNGINVFPVAGNYAIGMHVRCHGAITFYCGEVELNLSEDNHGDIKVIDDEAYICRPEDVSCKEAMAKETIGNLVRTSGTVVEIHKTADVVDKIFLRDNSGTACIFINGYIEKDDTSLDKVKLGMKVSAIGIGSRDVDETSTTNAIFARLRVRDRGEIVILNSNEDISAVFNDVKQADWFYDSVKFSTGADLLNGTSQTTFAPQASLTRAMVATVLHRLADEPAASRKIKDEFKDVKPNMWYTTAIEWAQSERIVDGYDDDTFRPNQKITRQELAVMIARYAETIAKLDMTTVDGFGKMTDSYKVATWARQSVLWCSNKGIINGIENKIEPTSLATRAQFATIIMRLAQVIETETPED